MPCHNQQVACGSNCEQNTMKQVRFASGDDSDSESLEKESEAAVNSDPQIQLKLLPLTDQIRELQTIIRDKWALTMSLIVHALKLTRVLR